MTAPIVVRSPGKLFIAGEYAVVTPGEPAVLVAVDRYLTVRLTPSAHSGSIHSPEFGRTPLVWGRTGDGLTIDTEHHPYEYVLAAITLAERLRSERGLTAHYYDLHIDSGLDDASGRKFGLGSSAAVTIATIRAIDEFYGFGLSRRDAYRLALLATVQVAPQASGGDLAASAFGGWISYRSPDRRVLRQSLDEGASFAELLASPGWEPMDIARLTPPASLRFLVGWTGRPASTARLVDAVRDGSGAMDYPAFLLDSRACVTDLARALDEGDDSATLDAVRRARRLLRRLGRSAGVAIETDALAALCDTAESAGAAAKSSGAGGGDCGIVLAPEDADIAGMLRDWEERDIRHLTLSVSSAEGGAP